MMKIYDGREFFYQWDLSQKITSDAFEVGDKIHFFNIRQTNALVVSAYELDGKVVADVPNILLQTAIPIKVWKYVHGENSAQTVMEDTFKVEQRAQPYDYFYTETELYELRKEIEDTNAEAKDAVSQLQIGLDNAKNALELANDAIKVANLAEKTSTANEQARIENEEQREVNESNRALAETQRAVAEQQRVDAEVDRDNAESNRLYAEHVRNLTEAERVENETARQTAEKQRASNESTREKNETARATAESNRAKAETERVTAETARKTAETSRGTAESQRVTAEQNRMEAEQNRETAEQNRAAAEELRQANFESLPNNIGNAVKGVVSGEVVRVDDVSPIEHTATVKVSGENIDPTSVTVTRRGKNLLDLSEFEFDDDNYTHTFNTPNATAVALYDFLKRNKGKGITLSAKITGTISGVGIGTIRFYDENKTLINIISPNKVYTIEELPDKFGSCIIYGSTTGASVKDIQIEYGDTATGYEPYNGTTYTPAADGTCEIVSLSPTMTLFTDTEGVTIDLEYNQDTTKALENVKSDLRELDNTVAEIILNGGGGGDTPISNYYTKDEIDEKLGDIETALDNIIAIQETLIGGDSV
jgi:chemotaxis protein histidine kinase CheA